jgi:hypothetical protein
LSPRWTIDDIQPTTSGTSSNPGSIPRAAAAIAAAAAGEVVGTVGRTRGGSARLLARAVARGFFMTGARGPNEFVQNLNSPIPHVTDVLCLYYKQRWVAAGLR